MHGLSWWLLVASTISSSVLSRSIHSDYHNDVALPCLALSQHSRTLPRCSNHSKFDPQRQDHESASCTSGVVTLNFRPAETKAGQRLVGSHRSDKYSCYPLSDEDFWRSREAVTMDASHI